MDDPMLEAMRWVMEHIGDNDMEGSDLALLIREQAKKDVTKFRQDYERLCATVGVKERQEKVEEDVGSDRVLALVEKLLKEKEWNDGVLPRAGSEGDSAALGPDLRPGGQGGPAQDQKPGRGGSGG